MKNKLALVIAVVLGLIAVYGVHEYIGKQEQKYAKKYVTVPVVAAAERIRAGTTIRPSMLTRIEISETGVSADHVLSNEADRLIGQTIIRTVERGEPLLASYFRQPVEKLEQHLGAGERAITLKVDPITGVAGNIAPGSHVDILGTFPQGGPSGARPGVSGVAALHTIPVLSNVTIIALDSRVREDDYTVAQSGQRTRNYSSVTVGVTPDEAALLIYAQQFGQLTLALRPPADATPPTTLDVSDKNLLDLVGQAEKKREERMKNKSAIEVVPANP